MTSSLVVQSEPVRSLMKLHSEEGREQLIRGEGGIEDKQGDCIMSETRHHISGVQGYDHNRAHARERERKASPEKVARSVWRYMFGNKSGTMVHQQSDSYNPAQHQSKHFGADLMLEMFEWLGALSCGFSECVDLFVL